MTRKQAVVAASLVVSGIVGVGAYQMSENNDLGGKVAKGFAAAAASEWVMALGMMMPDVWKDAIRHGIRVDEAGDKPLTRLFK